MAISAQLAQLRAYDTVCSDLWQEFQDTVNHASTLTLQESLTTRQYNLLRDNLDRIDEIYTKIIEISDERATAWEFIETMRLPKPQYQELWKLDNHVCRLINLIDRSYCFRISTLRDALDQYQQPPPLPPLSPYQPHDQILSPYYLQLDTTFK